MDRLGLLAQAQQPGNQPDGSAVDGNTGLPHHRPIRVAGRCFSLVSWFLPALVSPCLLVSPLSPDCFRPWFPLVSWFPPCLLVSPLSPGFPPCLLFSPLSPGFPLVSWFPPCLLVSSGPGFPFILIILVEYRQHELLYREVEESMGPNERDCPMRIMNQLGGHPPDGEYSARWRGSGQLTPKKPSPQLPEPGNHKSPQGTADCERDPKCPRILHQYKKGARFGVGGTARPRE